jgi:hypothetical protein
VSQDIAGHLNENISMKKILVGSWLISLIIVIFYGFNVISPIIPGEGEKAEMPDLKNWPAASQKAAREIEAKYGKPSGATSDMIIWNNNGVWAKTIVYKKETKHNFPQPHTDVVEQWINYRVAVNDFCKLAAFDGSITASRTNGTISVRCEKEAMNFLALNLADDMLKNNRTSDQARENYAKEARAFMEGKKPVLTQKLNFFADPASPDPDSSMETEKIKSGIGGQE